MSETTRAGDEASRFRFEYGQGETIIHMPVHRSFGHIVRILLITVMMALGGAFAYLLSIAGGAQNPMFYRVWLFLWALGMAGLVGYLVYALLGADRLIVRADGVERVRSILGLPYTQKFTPAEARSFQFTHRDKTARYKVGKIRVPISALVLANRDRYVSIARRVTAQEADAIMGAVRQRVGDWT